MVPSLCSSHLTEVYNPKAFITHAALLRQGFPHCAKFPTAASRRSLDRVSVPVWRIILSDPLDIAALVGRYPTNKLMSRRPLFGRVAPFNPRPCDPGCHPVLALLSKGCPEPQGRLSTCYSPVRHSTQGPKPSFAFDLHVLGTPPAFVLSQDQTLWLILMAPGPKPQRQNCTGPRPPLFQSVRPPDHPENCSMPWHADW